MLDAMKAILGKEPYGDGSNLSDGVFYTYYLAKDDTYQLQLRPGIATSRLSATAPGQTAASAPAVGLIHLYGADGGKRGVWGGEAAPNFG